MPHVSSIGLISKVSPITGNYAFAPDDTFASIQEGWQGGTVHLPGPDTNPDALPSNGDYYAVADPLGLLASGKALTIDGGGFPLLGGQSIAGVTTPFVCYEFTFDDTAQAWIVCSCGVQVAATTPPPPAPPR